MSEIIIIAALAENNIIGKDGKIPWNIKGEFQHFKDLTMGHVCVMGDITYESLPIKPLSGRENVVLTFDKNYNPPGAKIFFSWEEAMEYCKDKEKVFICGGASIYKLGLEVADTLELTRIHKNYEGETFFPKIDFDEWKLIKKEAKEAENLNDNKKVKFSFLTYTRKR